MTTVPGVDVISSGRFRGNELRWILKEKSPLLKAGGYHISKRQNHNDRA